MQIHLARDNVPAGPYSLEQLNAMLQNGEVVASDLMWHEGMDNWRTVGEMTGGRPYDPHATSSTINLQKQAPTTTTDDEWHGRHATTIAGEEGQTVVAGIGSRLLAFAINMVLFIISILPLQLAVMQAGFDEKAIQATSVAEYQALGETLAKALPSSAIYATFFMMVALASIQLLLLAKRGQSLGKLLVGIRIVDEKSERLAQGWQVLGVRTLVVFFVYQIASVLVGFLPLTLLLVNYIVARGNSKKQGWHDKISKTMVVKASPHQLSKQKGING